MKKLNHRITLLAVITAFAVIGLLATFHQVRAASGQLYLSPGSSSLQAGNPVTVTVRVSGSAIDGVQATVTYDASKLQYVSFSTAGSAFAAQLQQTQTNGSVTFARGDLSGGQSGDNAVESVTFKALVGSGSTSIGLTNANATSGGAYTNPAISGTTVSFSTPAAPAPTPTPAASNPSTAAPKATPSSSGNTAAPAAGNSHPATPAANGPAPASSPVPAAGTTAAPVKVDVPAAQYTSAQVHLSSAKPTKVYLKYGPAENQLVLTSAISDFATDHELSLADSSLQPGTTYYYSVVTIDQAGNTTTSAPASVTLKGLSLRVAIYDADHRPLAHKKVELHSAVQTVTTDGQGYANFTDVAPGTHHVVYTAGGKQYTQAIEAVNNIVTNGDSQSAPTQQFSVVYNDVSPGSLTWLRLGGLAAVLLLLAFAVFKFVGRVRTATEQPLNSQPIIVAQPNLPHYQMPKQFQQPGNPYPNQQPYYPPNSPVPPTVTPDDENRHDGPVL